MLLGSEAIMGVIMCWDKQEVRSSWCALKNVRVWIQAKRFVAFPHLGGGVYRDWASVLWPASS